MWAFPKVQKIEICLLQEWDPSQFQIIPFTEATIPQSAGSQNSKSTQIEVE
jgi:hypothetical protein